MPPFIQFPTDEREPTTNSTATSLAQTRVGGWHYNHRPSTELPQSPPIANAGQWKRRGRGTTAPPTSTTHLGPFTPALLRALPPPSPPTGHSHTTRSHDHLHHLHRHPPRTKASRTQVGGDPQPNPSRSGKRQGWEGERKGTNDRAGHHHPLACERERDASPYHH